MNGSIAGRIFGEELSFADLSTSPKIDVMVAAKSDITQIDLVRNGETIHTVSPESWQARFLYEDDDDLTKLKLTSRHLERFVYYYVRVTCNSGAQAWSSPVWILG